MNDRPPSSSSSTDGEFLLRLLQNHRIKQPPTTYNPSLDPAVSAVGPSLSPPSQNPNYFPPWPHQFSPSHTTSFHPAPHHHFRHQQSQSPPINFDLFNERELGVNLGTNTSNGFDPIRRMDPRLNRVGSHSNNNFNDSNLDPSFDLFKERELGFNPEASMRNGFDSIRGFDPRLNRVQSHGSNSNSSIQRDNHFNDSNLEPSFDLGGGLRSGFDSIRRIEPRRSGPPPGFSGSNSNHRGKVGSSSGLSSELGSNYRGFSGGSNGKDLEKERRFLTRVDMVGVRGGGGLSQQLENPGLPAGSDHVSVLGLDVEESFKVLHGGEVDNGVSQDEVDELSEQLVDSVLDDGPSDEKGELSGKKKNPRDKDFRSDARGKWILPQRTRNTKKMMDCRRDIYRFGAPFLTIFKSLIPPEEERLKQKQLMTLLEKLVCSEWPNAKLYLYGSCANSFGVSKSDIDVCFAIEDQDINKAEVLLKLADILQSDNLQNVQALTRARVPIVKLMDPVTGISCDICINNVLAVVNTKLLRDYAEIDARLRQLAFLVKHWAKSRGINETYQGTLSSYAYVLMCIHFLQQRNPPILPCLQGMKATYAVTVDDIECAFFDQVEKLRNFGAHNKENIAQLLWAFFSYWAYCHDYANTVISVRTGNILSKHEKDWTRRVGNDRHLICIEDPFEVSHDLGRVVDKHSIRVLREEFERAAWIMQHDPNPCVSLFEPYVPPAL